MQHERRRYPRVKRTIPLEMQKKRLFLMRGPKNTAEIIDVSRSGARIKTRIDLKEGEGVVLVLKTKAIRHALEFAAKVMWIKEVRGQQGVHNQAGLRFQAVTAEMSSLLFRMAVGQMDG